MAQPGTAQAWNLAKTACFRKDFPVQIRAVAFYLKMSLEETAYKVVSSNLYEFSTISIGFILGGYLGNKIGDATFGAGGGNFFSPTNEASKWYLSGMATIIFDMFYYYNGFGSVSDVTLGDLGCVLGSYVALKFHDKYFKRKTQFELKNLKNLKKIIFFLKFFFNLIKRFIKGKILVRNIFK